MNNQTENMENQTPATESTPGNPGALSFTVPAVTLRAALKACAPAMSEDPNRYILNGLYFELSPAQGALASHSVLSIVGCDGRRLHVAQIPVYDFPAPRREVSLILPAKHVKTLIKDCLPAKVKTGEAFIDVTRRAAAIVNPAPVQWIRVSTSAGEMSAPEQGGNYPNFRQVIPRPTIADNALMITAGDLLDVTENEKGLRESFKTRCLRAACQSVNDQRLPYSEAQVKSMIAKDVNRMIKTVTSRGASAYFGKEDAGRCYPLPLSIGPTPLFKITETGLVMINGEDKLELSQGVSPVAFDRPPNPARVSFNPAYLMDLSDALSAFDAVPGSAYGPLQAHDALASFCLKSEAPIDSGKAFSFYAVIMPQRMMR
jgi:hypothetical protein